MTTALMVIDVQEGMQPKKAHDGEGVVSRIAELLKRARAAGVPVVYVQHDGSKEPGHPLTKGKPGHAIYHEIAPKDGETVVVKQTCNSFQDTDLDARLRAAKVDGLIVCGMQTEFCVDTAVRAAAERGYKITLVSDAHSTGDTPALKAKDIVAHHNFTLQEFAKVRRADEITF